MPKRIAIVQSNYIPWKGYFDLIARADEFVLLDDVQYTRRDWRNRNRIKTANGLAWLTIPVKTRGNYHSRIDEIEVAGNDWTSTHYRTIAHQYAHAPNAEHGLESLRGLYERARQLERLSDINRLFITSICDRLGVRTRIRGSEEFQTVEGKNERLLAICRQAGASSYLSGPSARVYLDEAAFRREGIEIEYADYSGYPEYRQQHPPFEHGVSIIDLLLNEGPNAPAYMKYVVRHEA